VNGAILCIGTELTRGEIENTNATWLAEQLTTLGVEVRVILVVDDDDARIREAVASAARAADVVVSTGGLGPTTDDITTAAVGRLLGLALKRHAPSLEAIRARMARYGRAMAPSNEKQADFPEGAAVLPNPHGTAPGFSVDVEGARLFVMPGVPGEMKPMFETNVAPFVRARRTAGMAQVRMKTFGLPESTVNDRLAGIEEALCVTIGYRAHFPEIEVKVRARAASDAEAAEQARTAAAAVRERLGRVVYGEGETTFPMAVGALLRERSLTMATAESCTGGLVGKLLTDASGSSDYFVGGVVSYANAVKTGVLGVDPATLEREGAVSEAVARQMAEGARRVLGADVALSLTGVAGPTGGTADKPVGLVHYAVATRDGTVARKILAGGHRGMVRHRAAFAGLALVREILLDAD
jgi:nicotinamide-nucleotide amidase